MDATEFLILGRSLEMKNKTMREGIEDMRDAAQSLSSPDFEEHYNPNRPQEASYVKALEKIDELTHELGDLLLLYMDYRTSLVKAMSNVTVKNGAEVLRLRYLKYYSWEQIAEELNADVRTVKRWHDAALKQVEVPSDAEKYRL